MEHNKDEYFPSSRIESLTDGIFAFAMTLLVLNLNAPELYGIVTNQELISKLYGLSNRFLIFLLSFFLLASAWGVHHRQFAKITKADNGLMWINMVRLLLVITIPFSSVLVGNYAALSSAVFFFDMNIFLICLISFIEWKYAVNHGLTESMSKEHTRHGDIKNAVPIFIAGAAVLLSFVDTSISLWTFATIPFVLMILKKFGKV